MNYNLDAAINLRGKTWSEAGYEQFCTESEKTEVIGFKQSILMTGENYYDIPEFHMAVMNYPDGNTPMRQYYTKARWKEAWTFHRGYVHQLNNQQ